MKKRIYATQKIDKEFVGKFSKERVDLTNKLQSEFWKVYNNVVEKKVNLLIAKHFPEMEYMKDVEIVKKNLELEGYELKTKDYPTELETEEGYGNMTFKIKSKESKVQLLKIIEEL